MGIERDEDRTRGELARLRAAVLAEPALAAALLELWRPDRFAEQVAAAGAQRGVGLGAGEVAALLASALRSARPTLPIAPPPGWLPADVVQAGGEARVGWAYFGARRLAEPFYADSLAGVAALPFNRLFRFCTPLAQLAAPPDALAPAGFIFHMSRCGSTLAAQMLAALDESIVVSEAAPIDEIVRSEAAGLGAEAHAAQLRAIVAAFGQRRAGPGQRLYVKLDSWHARALPLFELAFPRTPWVFLYRDPAEVLVSHLRRPGMQMTAQLVSPAFLGLDWRGEAPGEDYAARVLAAICDAAAGALDGGRGLAVSYDELPEALWNRVLPHFGVAPGDAEIGAMAAAAARDAKDPTRAFRPDSAAKQAAAGEAVRAAVRRHLADVHARLEAAAATGRSAPAGTTPARGPFEADRG